MNITSITSFKILDILLRRVNSIVGTSFTNLLAIFFYIGTRSLFHIKVQGLHNFSVSPSTIIAINHKRDLDEIIIPSTLHVSKTLFRPCLRMWFAAREDVFYRGFLSRHFQLPRILVRPLSVINLSVVMAAFRALPIGHLNHSTVGNMLRDVYKCEGNVTLKEVLKTEWIKEFIRLLPPSINPNLGDTRLKDFFRYDYRTAHAEKSDLSMLKSKVMVRTRTFLLDKIDSQLNHFSNILDMGGVLFFTPSDEHSRDGRFAPIRSGLHRLIRMVQTDVRILPVNIDYDFMTTGRMKIYLTIGPEINDLKRLTKSEFERLLQVTIARLGIVNLGQIGSSCLLRLSQDNSEVITKEQLVDGIISDVQKLSNLGLNVDNVLEDRRTLEKRLDKFVKYCIRKQWLRDGKNGKLIFKKATIMDSSRSNYNDHPIRYSYNELMTYQHANNTEEPLFYDENYQVTE